MTTINAFTAAAIPSTAASLGIGAQPAVPGRSTAPSAGVVTPNAGVGTGFSSVPVSVATPGTVAPATSNVQSVAAQLGATTNAVQSAQNLVASTFGNQTAAQFTQAASGGGIVDTFVNAVSKIAGFAANGMKTIEQAIQADMSANNGQVDPAKMQQYTMQMSNYEMLMQMAAKIQEKQERAQQVWLRI